MERFSWVMFMKHAYLIGFIALLAVLAGCAPAQRFTGQEAGTLGVKAKDLYTVVAGQDYGEHTLELGISGAGFTMYTFTFG